MDVTQYPELANEYNIAVSTTSAQLPTLILFQQAKETKRLPPVKDNGMVTKTILDKVCISLLYYVYTQLTGIPIIGRPGGRLPAPGALRGQVQALVDISVQLTEYITLDWMNKTLNCFHS